MENKLFLAAISRFASSIASAYHMFTIYRGDNKSLEDMVQSVIQRFDSLNTKATLRMNVTSQSLMYQGKPVGFSGLCGALSSQFITLGVREIIFTPPLEKRALSQLLGIMTSREPLDARMEKLEAFLDDGVAKPISLVPITVRSVALRLSDELIRKKLEPILAARAAGGLGLEEDLRMKSFQYLPDLYQWLLKRSEEIQGPARIFFQSLVVACRDGYFPDERFFKLLPPCPSLEKQLADGGWGSQAARFTTEDILARQTAWAAVGDHSVTDDLTMAEALLESTLMSSLNDKILGLSFLVRILNDKNAAALQEKAMLIGMRTWARHPGPVEDLRLSSLLSALRHTLTLPANMELAIFPLRNAAIESEVFRAVSEGLLSLGAPCFPPLIGTLEAEMDRGMRRKLCEVLAQLTRKWGPDAILEALPKATNFLIRNLIMVLGDARAAKAVPVLKKYVYDSQKIVRAETLRSLGKIGTPEAAEALMDTLTRSNDYEMRQKALDFFVSKKERSVLSTLMTMVKDEAIPRPWRRALYSAISSFGGREAKELLESAQHKLSFLANFNADEREDQMLIKELLSKIS